MVHRDITIMRKFKIQGGKRMEKLKPCPFCGGKAIFNVIENDSTHHSVGFLCEIVCEDCGMTLPVKCNVDFSLKEDGEINILNDGRPEAIEAWNRRTGN